MELSTGVLIASALGLFVGPALAVAWPREQAWRAALDGFTLAAVGGLVLFHLLPDALAAGGLWAAVAAAVGMWAPRLIGWAGAGPGLVLLAGVWVHAAAESAAIAASPGDLLLGLAVVLHRVPLGLAVYSAFARSGRSRGLLAVVSVAAAILVGALLGAPARGLGGAGLLEGFVAGMLMHVAFDAHAEEAAGRPRWSTLGALVGLGVVAATVGGHTHDHGAGPGFGETLALLTLRTAPALLAAYLLAAVLHVATRRFLPVGGCGVPVRYSELLARGLPPAAAVGVLVGAPVLGVDALLVSAPLLGGGLTAARAVAGLGIAAGLAGLIALAGWGGARQGVARADGVHAWRAGLRYGLVELVDHSLPWVLVGLVAAALMEPVLGYGLLDRVPTWVQVLLAVAAGLPAYVCASGATPIAAMAIHKGVSPGAALAFLVVGPATNAAALRELSEAHGRGAAAGVAGGVALGALGVGLLIDTAAFAALAGLHEHAHAHPTPVELGAVLGLGALLLASALRRGPRGVVAELFGPDAHGRGDAPSYQLRPSP